MSEQSEQVKKIYFKPQTSHFSVFLIIYFYNCITVYVVIFAVVYFCESDPRENFHLNLCLFIVMKTSEKSRN